MIFKIVGTICLAALCGWLFRVGGSANTHARWARMFGVEVSELGGLILWFGWSPWILLTTGLAWTECTYFKKKGTDATWINWMFCGLQYSAIPIPLLFVHILGWKGLVIRALVLTPIITLWRTFQTDVQWSESGAGAWQLLTLPLLILK